MRRTTLLCCLLLGPVHQAVAQFPATPPDPGPIVPPPPVVVQDFRLPNGLRASLIENHRQPIVTVVLSLPAGSAYDPKDQEGTADLLAGLLTRGAGARDADQVAEALEAAGGSLSTSVDPDFLAIQADALSGSAEAVIGLMADAILRPRLDPQELDRLRQQTQASLQLELSNPGAIASRVFLRALYGEHPYGRRVTPTTVNNIGRRDVEAFRLARFRPASAQLVIAGDISLEEARRIVTERFGDWRGIAATQLGAVVARRSATQIILVHDPSAESANILIGNTTIRGADSSYYIANVVDRLLGGTSQSRLARILRDDKDWTRTPTSALSRPLGLGMFQVGVEARTEATDSVLRQILSEMRRVRTDTVPGPELGSAKSEIANEYLLNLQTTGQLAAAVLKARQLGVPTTQITSYPARIRGLSSTRIRSGARNVVRPDSALAVVIGDAGMLYRTLKTIAPVRILAPDGTALKPEDVEPKATGFAIDMALLVPRRDSLIVMAQDRPVGAQVATLERSGPNLVYTETTNIGEAIRQTSRVTMDTAGRVLALDQVGRLQGQDTRIVLDYSGGRAKGSAKVIGTSGPISFTIDTVIPPGVTDDNAIQAVLPALKWGPNVQWTIPVFSSGQNRLRTFTLTVRAVGMVTVPAGSFQAYLADLEGEAQKITFYVSVQRPHRLLRLSISGTALEFVAARPAD